jgi:hypothetical protein
MTLKLACVKDPNGNLGPHTACHRVVALRVEVGETSTNGEMHNLAKPVKKPWKTQARCVAAGVPRAKGSWLLELQHYKFETTDGASGNSTYILKEGPGSTFIVPLVCVVHNIGDIAFKELQAREPGAEVDAFVLSSETHEVLMTVGALTPNE